MNSHSHNSQQDAVRKEWPEKRICYAKFMILLLLIALPISIGSCQGRGGTQFDGEKAYEHVVAQVAFGPRPVGSESLARTADYIESYLETVGWTARRVVGEFRGTQLRNIVAEKSDRGSNRGARVLIGAHYDTRPLADRDPVVSMRRAPVPGANDGASGVAVLLELARVFDPAKSKYDVVLAFFDGEDKGGIDGWPFCVGSDLVAERLADEVSEMILLDMVGDSDLRIFYEGNSDQRIAGEIWATARRLGYGECFVPEVRYSLMDDHIPFLRRGVPAVDIIDFDYAYWHTTADTADKVSPKSLEMVGRVVLEYLYRD